MQTHEARKLMRRALLRRFRRENWHSWHFLFIHLAWTKFSSARSGSTARWQHRPLNSHQLLTCRNLPPPNQEICVNKPFILLPSTSQWQRLRYLLLDPGSALHLQRRRLKQRSARKVAPVIIVAVAEARMSAGRRKKPKSPV